MKRLDVFVVVKFKVTKKVQNSSECSSDISSASEPSVTRLGMVMQHHGPKCHARRLVNYLQVQGHNEGLFDQIQLSVICAELLICLQPNLIGWYIIISWSALCKN